MFSEVMLPYGRGIVSKFSAEGSAKCGWPYHVSFSRLPQGR